jgi:hypothetical protein
VPRFYLIVAASSAVLEGPAAFSFLWGPRMDQVLWWWAYYPPWMSIVVGAIGVIAALTTRPAAEVARAAQKWGQDDDITVLTIRSRSAPQIGRQNRETLGSKA